MPPAPGLTTGLSQRSQVTDPPRRADSAVPCGSRAALPAGLRWDVRPRRSTHAWHHLAGTARDLAPSSFFSRDLEESDREEQAAAEEAVPRRNVGVNGLLPLLGLQLLNLRLQVGPKASRSPPVIRRFPTEERSAWTQATERVGEATTWPYAVFH